jgi:aryl-alcohol dehydrogenase-like predicted oxidoreductase
VTLDEARLRATTPKWQRVLALREFAGRTGRPLLDLAFQFCRGNPAVSVTLLGMRVENHLRDNLRYLDGVALSPDEYSTLRQLCGGA